MFPAGPRRIAVILNPASGRGQGARRRVDLEQMLARMATDMASNGTEWKILETTGAGSAGALARRAVEEGANVVAAAGGDGTLNEVVNGMVGIDAGAACGLLPLGTGNDFARHIRLGTDLERAVHTLFHGAPQPVDLGRAGDRWFINIAGCGFDALVADRINRGIRNLHGTAAYVAAVCQCLLTLRAAHLTLTLDGQTLTADALMCSVANASCYGGGMRIAPEARIDDGLFDICLLRDAGRLEFLRAFPRVFKGTHITHPKVTMLRAVEVTIQSDPPLPILIDGDVVGTTPVTFTLHPHALPILMPSSNLS
jgi:diacylglycerol kinase (ATP)